MLFIDNVFEIVTISNYLYKYTNNYIIIRIRVGVIILVNIVDYYMNTIYDMQNEEDCFYQYNEFLHIRDCEKSFSKIVDSILVHGVLNNRFHLYLIVYYKFVLLVLVFG